MCKVQQLPTALYKLFFRREKMNEIEQVNEYSKKMETLQAEIDEMNQPRSNYALTHFVVGQHDMPARQRQQVLVELQTMMFNLADLADEIKLAEVEIDEKKYLLNDDIVTTEFDKQRYNIQICQLERKITSLRFQITGRLRECDTLYAMLEQMPRYDRSQFEAEEEEYWGRRLKRQYFLAQRDMGGNLTALLETVTQPGKVKPELQIHKEDVLPLMGVSEEGLKQISQGGTE
jgi:hypothetical protein